MKIGSFSYVFNEHIKIERESLINGIKLGKTSNSVAASEHIKAFCLLAISLLATKRLLGYNYFNNPQKLKAGLLKTKNRINKEVMGQGYENECLATKALEELEKLRDRLT